MRCGVPSREQQGDSGTPAPAPPGEPERRAGTDPRPRQSHRPRVRTAPGGRERVSTKPRACGDPARPLGDGDSPPQNRLSPSPTAEQQRDVISGCGAWLRARVHLLKETELTTRTRTFPGADGSGREKPAPREARARLVSKSTAQAPLSRCRRNTQLRSPRSLQNLLIITTRIRSVSRKIKFTEFSIVQRFVHDSRSR